MTLRDAVERHSAMPVVFLHQLPRWVLPVIVGTLMLVGLLVTGWAGASAMIALAIFIGWFGYLSWPRLDLAGRMLRIGALVLLVVLAGGHFS
ncbi:MAG: DUF6703 family protein [Streptosporangiaceae bacterium]